MAAKRGTLLNDLFNGGLLAEQYDGLTGYDVVSYENSTARVQISLTRPAINTGDAAGDTYVSIESFRLTKFNDYFEGAATNDTVNGGLGNDQLYGMAGNDSLSGHTGNDTLNGGDGNDGLWGGGDADVLSGENGADKLYGDSGNDTLNGGAGNDLLTGGAGSDTIFGGAGADIFVFSTASGTDDFRDFEVGTDKISLAAQYWDGNAANGEAVISNFYGVASQIRLTDNSADGYVDNCWMYIGNSATSSTAQLQAAMANHTLFVV